MFSEIFSTQTEGVHVRVRANYLKDQSNPKADLFFFSYLVEIVNESLYTIQLMRRRWEITDALGRKRIVDGEGVIGIQPILKPDARHAYQSAVDFHTPVGKMEGHYVMHRKVDATDFLVRIPTFVMVAPHLLN